MPLTENGQSARILIDGVAQLSSCGNELLSRLSSRATQREVISEVIANRLNSVGGGTGIAKHGLSGELAPPGKFFLSSQVQLEHSDKL